MPNPRTLLTAVLATTLVAGCIGRVGDRGGSPSDANVPGSDGGVVVLPDGAIMRPPPPPFVPAPATMQRLTLAQYRNSVRDLLGDVTVPADLEVDTPLHGFASVGASELTIGPRAAEQYEAAALDVARQIFANATRRVEFVGCAPGGAADPCVRAFIASFGRRAWRRPLTMEEVDRWHRVVTNVGNLFRDVTPGLEYATAGILQSPNFLFRVALGGPGGTATNPTWRRLTDYELAARMSYFLWNTTPDNTLLDAAERGELATPDGLRAQARRLLMDGRARTAVTNFFTEYFKLDRLDNFARDPMVFPQYSPTLGRSMRTEITRVLENVIFDRETDLRDIYTTRETFVNAELARLYNLPAPTPMPGAEFAAAVFPDSGPRAGFLTMAGILALNAHQTVTSPVLRGKFIRSYLLCQDVPPPPGDVNTMLPEPPMGVRQTLRQRLETVHLVAPQCAGCHALMDPLGFGLENFDAIGAYRTTDNGLPVDSSGSLDGRRFANARELGTVLRADVRTGPCIARQVYRYATAQLERREDQAVLEGLADAFDRGGYRFRALMTEVVATDGFRYVAAMP